MRYNAGGLLGFTAVVLGVVAGGLWIISLAQGHDTGLTVAAGVCALVLLVGGLGWLVWTYSRVPRTAEVAREHRDPLEPEITQAEADEYEQVHHGRFRARDLGGKQSHGGPSRPRGAQ